MNVNLYDIHSSKKKNILLPCLTFWYETAVWKVGNKPKTEDAAVLDWTMTVLTFENHLTHIIYKYSVT